MLLAVKFWIFFSSSFENNREKKKPFYYSKTFDFKENSIAEIKNLEKRKSTISQKKLKTIHRKGSRQA